MDVLTLTAAQVDRWDSTCGSRLVAVVVPASHRWVFGDSDAYYATVVAARMGVIVFVGPDRKIEVVPVRDQQVTLEASDARAVYLRFAHWRAAWEREEVHRTVEVIPGRVFADVDDEDTVLGVEVLL